MLDRVLVIAFLATCLQCTVIDSCKLTFNNIHNGYRYTLIGSLNTESNQFIQQVSFLSPSHSRWITKTQTSTRLCSTPWKGSRPTITWSLAHSIMLWITKVPDCTCLMIYVSVLVCRQVSHLQHRTWRGWVRVYHWVCGEECQDW